MRIPTPILVLALSLVFGATACTPSSTSADDASPEAGSSPAGPGGSDTSEAGAGDPGLGALTRVTGTVMSGDLVGTLDGDSTMPLALSVPSSGGGNGAVITGVSTGRGDTIVWDGGRPVTLSGDGTIALQPGPFRLGDGGLFADMSGAAHRLSPGNYAVAGPVAVGDGGGLAAPSTQTSFTAGEAATLSGTGQVEGRLPAGTWLLLGPGRVSLRGTLEIQTTEGSTDATEATMEDGSYEVTVTVADDGTVTVDALLDGTVT